MAWKIDGSIVRRKSGMEKIVSLPGSVSGYTEIQIARRIPMGWTPPP